MSYKIKLDREKLQKELTPLEYNICLNHGTEAPFQNEFYDAKSKGTYFCKCCHTPLFDSDAKFDSGTGWPSYFKAVNDEVIEEIVDDTLGMRRVEVLNFDPK